MQIKRTRLMVICCLTLVVMLFTTAQALAYTYTVKNETSKPVYASFYYMTDSDANDHHFNGGNAIAPGQSSTLHMKGVRCMARLNIKYEGKWHYYDSPGCGNKSFTLTEGLKIHKD